MATSMGKTVDSRAFTLEELFGDKDKFCVDFYQREYVWQSKQIEDLIADLSGEFLKNWEPGDELGKVTMYDPYFMGEVVLSTKSGERNSIIDGQQRITTLTLVLIYMLKTFGHLPKFPDAIKTLIFSDDHGTPRFNLEIPERIECMEGLLNNGTYSPRDGESPSVFNIVARYDDIAAYWDPRINEDNAVAFAYWLKEKVIFSKVWTNNSEFAYVIFETMNDRGLSLTEVEMFRSYLLANIDPEKRTGAMKRFDEIISRLVKIKLSSKSKAESEFFRVYFRSHLAEDFSQGKNANSDFTKIGKEFHRWIRDNERKLGLVKPTDYLDFLGKIEFFAKAYETINKHIQDRDAGKYLYLVVNSDYNFTLQTPAILASIAFGDSDEIIEEKISIVSKYITKVLTWRTWRHWMISQSSMESHVYQLCKSIRGVDVDTLKAKLSLNPIEMPELSGAPTLNQQIKNRLRVMLSLITAIVGRESGEFRYMLNESEIEVEHIWSDHYDQHTDEFASQPDFDAVRNNIGDLLVLPKKFNTSYGDDPFEEKVKRYYSQNILAQSLCEDKYSKSPGFIQFKSSSGLPFKPYAHFKRADIMERADLYKAILEWDLN